MVYKKIYSQGHYVSSFYTKSKIQIYKTHVGALEVLTVLILWSVCSSSLPFTGSCDSCGRECQSACGTRGFRTCCLNYLKKRSSPIPPGSEMKLELMMVLPELVQYYPSLRSLIPDTSDQNQLKMLFEKPDAQNSDSEE